MEETLRIQLTTQYKIHYRKTVYYSNNFLNISINGTGKSLEFELYESLSKEIKYPMILSIQIHQLYNKQFEQIFST
jgi:hypothetical protein